MKHIVLIAASALALAACTGKDADDNTADNSSTNVTTTNIATNADIATSNVVATSAPGQTTKVEKKVSTSSKSN